MPRSFNIFAKIKLIQFSFIFEKISEDKFQIEPSSGRLNPGEFIELKITLEASSRPSFYSGEIECTIYWGNHEM